MRKSLPRISFLITLIGILFVFSPVSSQGTSECDPLGWFPADFGLKDHSVFVYEGVYYLVSNYLPDEQYFAYARSADLCHWEKLTPVLEERASEWDALAVWRHLFWKRRECIICTTLV